MRSARRYEDLVCWQLADELEEVVFELTAAGPVSKDFKFRDQIRDSSSSATRNMAEGFGRYWPLGFKKGYFTSPDTERSKGSAADRAKPQ